MSDGSISPAYPVEQLVAVAVDSCSLSVTTDYRSNGAKVMSGYAKNRFAIPNVSSRRGSLQQSTQCVHRPLGMLPNNPSTLRPAATRNTKCCRGNGTVELIKIATALLLVLSRFYRSIHKSRTGQVPSSALDTQGPVLLGRRYGFRNLTPLRRYPTVTKCYIRP